MKTHSRRTLHAAVVSAICILCLPLVANAGLTVRYQTQGKVNYTADGLGQNGAFDSLQTTIPAGSTILKAFIHGTYFSFPSAADRTINFDGTTYTMVQISSVGGLHTTEQDVTLQVALKVGSGGATFSFPVYTDPPTLDGISLTVVYSNPTLTNGTVAVLAGSQAFGGDTATLTLAAPLDKTILGFQAIMSLGSGFSYQGGFGAGTHDCGTGQFSTVDVNGARLTSCAGNYDDGVANNGALITVGGEGDDTLNPPNPLGPGGFDDELYNIAPFLAQGATQIEIFTTNPSNNDNLFLEIIQITATGTVTTEVCDDGIDNDGDGLIDAADPDCVHAGVEVCGNHLDDDADGVVDNGCHFSQHLTATPGNTNLQFNFTGVANLAGTTSFQLGFLNGVIRPFDVTVDLIVQNCVNIESRLNPLVFPAGTFGHRFQVTDGSQPPCGEFEIKGGVAGVDYVPGNPNVPRDGVKFTEDYNIVGPKGVAAMGYGNLLVYTENILDSFIPGPPPDPRGVGYKDTYGSFVTMLGLPAAAPILVLPPAVIAEATGPTGARVNYAGLVSATGVVRGLANQRIIPVCTPPSGSVFPLGTTLVRCSATGSEGGTTEATFNVIVRDTTAPALAFTLSPNVLKPPNHKLMAIVAKVKVTDAVDTTPTLTLISITSNEPDNGLGDGDKSNDIQDAVVGTDDRQFQLRSERSGKGSGRIYTVRYRAIDDAGNLSPIMSATVVVPH